MFLNSHAWSSRSILQVSYIFSHFFCVCLYSILLYILRYFLHFIFQALSVSLEIMGFSPKMLRFYAAHEYQHDVCCFICHFSCSVDLFHSVFVLLICFGCYSNDTYFIIGSFGVHLVIVIPCVVVLFSGIDCSVLQEQRVKIPLLSDIKEAY